MSMVAGQQRVAVFTSTPAPYRDQLFRELGKLVGSLRIYYVSPTEDDRPWKTTDQAPSRRLKTLASLGRFGGLQPGVFRAVRRSDVVIVGGYHQFTYVLALLLGRLLRKRVVLFFDGIAPSRFSRGGFLLQFKRVVVSLPHVSLANGAVGQLYFTERLKVPPAQVRNQYLVPVQFGTKFDKLQRSTLPKYDVLFVGRLIPRKGADVLIDALRELPDLRLAIVGSGPLKAELETRAEGLNVEFLGELVQQEVAALMADARCLVAPSHDEPWGLVVQEAMQSDLPVVVTSDVGCAADLVMSGGNGIIAETRDRTSLARAIQACIKLSSEDVHRCNDTILNEWTLSNHVRSFSESCLK